MPDLNLIRIQPFQFSLGELTNITPFTYRDGLTFLELIESLRDYMNSTIIPAVNHYTQDPHAETKLNEKLAEITKAFNENMTRIEKGDKASQDELTKLINDKIGTSVAEVNELIKSVNATLAEKTQAVDNAVNGIDPKINSITSAQNTKIEQYKTANETAFAEYKNSIDAQVASIKGATGISIVKVIEGNNLSPSASWSKNNPLILIMTRRSMPFTITVTGFVDHTVKKTWNKASEWPVFIAVPMGDDWHLFNISEFDPSGIDIPKPYTPPEPNFTKFNVQRMNIDTQEKFVWFEKKTSGIWKIEDQYIECKKPGLYRIDIDLALSGTSGTWGNYVYATTLINTTAVRTHWYMRASQVGVRMTITERFRVNDKLTIKINAQSDGLALSAPEEYSLITATEVR